LAEPLTPQHDAPPYGRPSPPRPKGALTLAEVFQAATSLHRRGEHRRAEDMYRAVLGVAPTHVGALHHLGALCTQTGRPVEAIERLRAAAAGDPGSASIHCDLGLALAAVGRTDEAIAQYEKAIALEPGRIDSHNNLGNALLSLKRPEQAIAHFERALAIRPNAATVHNNLGNALVEAQRFDDAVAHYRKALEGKPDFAEARNNLGLALLKLNRRKEAIEQFEAAIALQPRYGDPYKHLARTLVAVEQRDAAVAHFQTALAIDPRDAATQNDLGNCLAVLGRDAEAIVRYSQALALRPDFAEGHNNLANSLAALNQHEEALAHYRRALSQKPELIETLNNLGGSLEALERTDEAIACYDEVLAREPANARAHYFRGQAFRTLGRFAEAQASFEQAIALDSTKPEFYRGLAESKRFSADDPHLLAMEALARDMTALPPDGQIELHFALAKVYEDLGRHEDAFRRLVEGNALKRRRIVYDETETLGLFRRIASVFTPEFMRRPQKQDDGDPSELPIFIIGMPRSGSTLVEQVLASHPKVFGAGEITDLSRATGRIWGSDLAERFPEAVASATPERLRALAADYLAGLRRRSSSAERITDKALGNVQLVGLINLTLPRARIIHVRRDPIDTCLSAFSKLFTQTQPHTFDLGELGRYYRAYETLMAHWRGVLPDGAMLEIDYERLVADFEPQARRIVDYVGLAWDDRCAVFHQTQRAVRTASAAQVRQPIYRTAVGRSGPYRAMLTPLLDALGVTRRTEKMEHREK
jgi:tetratricopeptide (TPR) repeat protein